MTWWQALLVTSAGNIVFFCLQVWYFHWKQRQHSPRDLAKEGERTLKFEMMWKDYKERKHINGGEWKRSFT